MNQGTQDWIDARLGHITASRFADVRKGRILEKYGLREEELG